MTGGKEKTQTNQMIAADRAQQANFANTMNQQQGARSDTAYGQNQGSYNDIYQGYKNFASGNFDTSGIGGGGGGFVPNFDTGKWGDVQSMYRNAMGAGGGLDPNRIASMDVQLKGLGDIGQYGASDAAAAARARGGGIYENMAATGGYTPEQIIQTRNQAMAPVSALYGNMRSELGRQGTIGGAAPNTAAAIARMSRQGAQDVGTTSASANLALQDQIRQNKMAGAQGLASTEQAITGNRMSGLGAALGGQQGLAESIRSGQQWGTGGLQGIAAQESAAQEAAAASAAASAGDLARYKNQMMLAGLGGMSDVRGGNLGMEQFYTGNQYGGQGQLQSGQGQTINERIQNNPYISPWQIASALTGAGAGVMTGLGNMGVGRK